MIPPRPPPPPYGFSLVVVAFVLSSPFALDVSDALISQAPVAPPVFPPVDPPTVAPVAPPVVPPVAPPTEVCFRDVSGGGRLSCLGGALGDC